MVTFATQKARIASEMVRDDIASGGSLETLLEQHYQDAVAYYEQRKFWFNSILTTATTSAGVATVSVPATVQTVERVTIPAYDTELREVTLGQLPDEDTQGLPSCYAYYNDSLRFSLVPDAAYTLNIYGVSKVAAPTTGTDDNIWTNEAAPLIRGHTKMTLCRSVFRDAEGVQLALAETSDALSQLQRQTAARLETILRPRMGGGRYNIFSD